MENERQKPGLPPGPSPEKGGVFTVLLASVAIAGAVAYGLYQNMSGPVSAQMRAANTTQARRQMESITNLLIRDTLSLSAGSYSSGDCDADHYLEPRGWRSGSGPTGGGLVPSTIGAPTKDLWGTDYGYCVWDVGTVKNAGCDNDGAAGANARHLSGTTTPTTSNTKSSTIIAIISAGPDRHFQSSCHDYSSTGGVGTETTDVVTQAGDDIVVRKSYVEASSALADLWALKPSDSDTAVINKALAVGPTASPKMTVDATGLLHADTLTTASGGRITAGGAVELAHDAAGGSCVNPTNLGSLRYNTTSHTLQVCLTGGWSDVVSASGSTALSDIKAGTATNSIDSLLNPQVWGWSTLATATTALTLSATNSSGGANGTLNVNNSSTGLGAYGLLSTTSGNAAASMYAVYGVNTGASNTGAGVYGVNTGSGVSYGVRGDNTSSGAGSAGVYGSETQSGTYGVVGVGTSSAYGVYSSGPAYVSGALTVNAGAGVNSIDVHSDDGAIRLPQGDTSLPTCNGSALGALRYNTSSSGAEYCDNTSAWKYVKNTSSIDALTDGISDTTSTVYLGTNAGSSSTGTGNTGVGIYALASNVGRQESTAVGYQAMRYAYNTTTSGITYNTAFGAYALQGSSTAANNTGTGNTAVGHSALASSTDGSDNTGIGYFTMNLNTSGAGNTAVGGQALRYNRSGSRNTAVSYLSAVNAYAMTGNTSIGYQALYYGNTTTTATSPYNTAIGHATMRGSSTAANNTGVENTAIGYNALTAFTSASYNVVVGPSALISNTTGSYNVAVGPYALNSNIGKNGSTAVGLRAMQYGDNTSTNTATNNTAVGVAALYGSTSAANNTGINNTAVGYNPLYSNTSGSDESAIGWASLTNNTSGIRNTAAGMYAGYSNVGIQEITAIGYSSMYYANSAASGTPGNTAVGAYSFYGSTTAANNTGVSNTAIGHYTLYTTTTGSRNVAFGRQALTNLTTGSDNTILSPVSTMMVSGDNKNTSIGYGFFFSSTSSVGTHQENTSLGAMSLAYNAASAGTPSSYNVAIGGYTLGGSCSGCAGAAYGSNNTVAGHSSFTTNRQQGGNNTSLGYKSINGIRDTDKNTAIGAYTIFSMTNWAEETFVGYYSGYYHNANGGSGATNYSAAMGTYALRYSSNNINQSRADYSTAFGHSALKTPTDNTWYNTAIGSQALVAAGPNYGNNATNNTAIGYNTLSSLTTGHYSLAIGDSACATLTTVDDNTCIGYNALKLATQYRSTAIGAYALAAQTSGSASVAIGYKSLQANDTGAYNVAIGYKSLYTSTSASNSTAIGDNALYSTTVGFVASNLTAVGSSALYSNKAIQQNTAVGYYAMYYANNTTTASQANNTAIGAYSMQGSTTASSNTGTSNTAAGHSSLMSVTSGSSNVAFGYNAGTAGTAITSGGTNTLIGYQAQVDSAAASNRIAIGANAVSTSNNDVTLGDSNIATIHAQVTSITAISDRREKTDIRDADLGLGFIKKLRPVSYRFKTGGPLRYGFIAQEVEDAMGADKKQRIETKPAEEGFALIERGSDTAHTYHMAYGELFAPIIKAVQQLAARFQALISIASLSERLEKIVSDDQAQEREILRLMKTAAGLRAELAELKRLQHPAH